MPGVIMYSECKNKLESLRVQRPEIFDDRKVYVAVLRLLDTFTFKLSARRDVLNLFSVQAKMRKMPASNA
jgi:hypothetical protein